MPVTEARGYRVRVQYPIVFEYRYAVYPNAQDWRVANRPHATIFKDEADATEAAHVISENTDIKAVGGKAEVEPVKSFDPDWCLHPGVHIKDQMTLWEMSEEKLAEKLEMPLERFQVLLAGGDEYIDASLAAKLAASTGTEATYWMNLETNFREGLRKGLTWTKDT